MKKYLNIPNLYIALWCTLNSGVIPSDTINVAVLGVILVLSLFYTAKVLFLKSNPKVIKSLVFFVFLLSIYGFYLIISGEKIYLSYGVGRVIKNREYLNIIYQSILPIFTFYYFFRKGMLSKEMMIKWIYIFIPVVILTYFNNQTEMIAVAINSNRDEDSFTNNIGYEFLSLFPILAMCNQKKFLQYSGFAICIVFLFMSVKRGAILIAVIALLWYFYESSKKSKSAKIRTLIVAAVLSYFVYEIFIYMVSSSDYFMWRVQETLEGNSSGRDNIYTNIWNIYVNGSSFLQQLFGRGAYGSLKIGENVAHNDWLELLIDLGILGVFAYYVFWLNLSKLLFSQKRDEDIFIPLGLFGLVYFMKTLFSMSYTTMTIYATIVFSYCVATSIL